MYFYVPLLLGRIRAVHLRGKRPRSSRDASSGHHREAWESLWAENIKVNQYWDRKKMLDLKWFWVNKYKMQSQISKSALLKGVSFLLTVTGPLLYACMCTCTFEVLRIHGWKFLIFTIQTDKQDVSRAWASFMLVSRGLQSFSRAGDRTHNFRKIILQVNK